MNKDTFKITYKFDKDFNSEQVQSLFLAINWQSGKYPNHLFKALMNSQTVATAWCDGKLVGLARAIDDGSMLAYVHYVLVLPEFQGCGIASRLIQMIKDKYHDFFYIEVMPEDRRNVPFYEHCGFNVMPYGASLQIVNSNIKD